MTTQSRPEPRASVLYVVSTPIGNRDDITLRALKILKSVDLIAAEDTRTTRGLLRHFEIETACISYHSHNESRRIPLLVRHLQDGKSLAVVSDAGTPGVSDPAALLISSVIAAGFPVVPIPGASAALSALVVSGFATDRFHFEGFLPLKKRRRTRIAELATEPRTIILYESVHRVRRTLRDLAEVFGERRIAVCRELTKLFEETLRGTIQEMIEHFDATEPRGEFVFVIDGCREVHDMHEPRPELRMNGLDSGASDHRLE